MTRVGFTPIKSTEWDPPDRREEFIANVTESVDGDLMCTISPPPTSELILLSEWVAAREGSFVALEAMC